MTTGTRGIARARRSEAHQDEEPVAAEKAS
jgi:hypothetical protein